MKKALIAALIVALLVIPLAGCGGGSDDATSTTTSTDPAGQTTTPTTPAASTTQSGVPRKLEYIKASLPTAFEKAVDDGFVVVVAFYDPDEKISNKAQDSIEHIVENPDYKTQITYLSYEVSGKTTSNVAKLTTVLGAKFLPHVAIIDGDKNIVFEDSGFTESNYFNHALYDVVYKDKSGQASTNK